ncbi:MAG: DUF1559 domain-containing protein [Gemmataceae bacterium]|nr:DUF1559 domain-containing protein [Gemmataceae bacterium]
MRQLGLAVIHYADNNRGQLPPGGNMDPIGKSNWNDDRGTMTVYTLPYAEQTPLFNLITRVAGGPIATTFNSVGIFRKSGLPEVNQTLPYGRCPSDDYQFDRPWVNYGGSMGPQCAIGPCGFDPYQGWCKPETSGFGGGVAGMGYTWSPDHGNSWDNSHIRGLFNRLGAKQRFPAGIPDGTSNTIMIGEGLPVGHDHLTNGSWHHFNYGTTMLGTIVPMNYQTQETPWCSPADKARHNWNISMGFRSNHTGGCNFTFADGSVQFLSQNIDHRTYQLLGCRNDGKPTGSWQ